MDAIRISKEQGARLKMARRAAGYRSARDAALQHEWAESTYSAHERGSRTIGLDDAGRYARAFGSSPIWILHGVGGEDNPLSSEVLSALGNLRGEHLKRAAELIVMLSQMQDLGVTVPPSPDIRHEATKKLALAHAGIPQPDKGAIRRPS